jgi:hypothetical protein
VEESVVSGSNNISVVVSDEENELL